MKTNNIFKQVIITTLCIALILTIGGSFNFIKAATSNKDLFSNSKCNIYFKTLADFSSDSSLIKLVQKNSEGKETKNIKRIIIDYGINNKKTTTKNLQSDMGTNTQIDYMVLTHWHVDHCNGLLEGNFPKSYTINNLYVNSIFFAEENGQRYIQKLITDRKIKNLYCFNYRGKSNKYNEGGNNKAIHNFLKNKYDKFEASKDCTTVKYYDYKNKKKKTGQKNTLSVNFLNKIHYVDLKTNYGVTLSIIPSIAPVISKKDYGAKDKNENPIPSNRQTNDRSLMCVLADKDAASIKAVFPGDIQVGTISTLLETQTKSGKTEYVYKDILGEISKNNYYTTLIYKASHHGKARHKEYFNGMTTKCYFSSDELLKAHPNKFSPDEAELAIKLSKLSSVTYGFYLIPGVDTGVKPGPISFLSNLIRKERELINVIDPDYIQITQGAGAKQSGTEDEQKMLRNSRCWYTLAAYINKTKEKKINLEYTYAGSSWTPEWPKTNW